MTLSRDICLFTFYSELAILDFLPLNGALLYRLYRMRNIYDISYVAKITHIICFVGSLRHILCRFPFSHCVGRLYVEVSSRSIILYGAYHMLDKK